MIYLLIIAAIVAAVYTYRYGGPLHKVLSWILVFAFLLPVTHWPYTMVASIIIYLAVITVLSWSEWRRLDVGPGRQFVVQYLLISTLVAWLFKVNHWAGATVLLYLSIPAVILVFLWLVRSRPFEDPSTGLIALIMLEAAANVVANIS